MTIRGFGVRRGTTSSSTTAQEAQAAAILGAEQMDGTRFEVCGVLQSTTQWAFDPTSGQKPAAEVVRNLATIVAKGGNYLLNVAPDASGVWPDSARASSPTSPRGDAPPAAARRCTTPSRCTRSPTAGRCASPRSARARPRLARARAVRDSSDTERDRPPVTRRAHARAARDASDRSSTRHPSCRLLQSTDFPAGEVTAWSLRDEGVSPSTTRSRRARQPHTGNQPSNAARLVADPRRDRCERSWQRKTRPRGLAPWSARAAVERRHSNKRARRSARQRPFERGGTATSTVFIRDAAAKLARVGPTTRASA